MIGKMLHELAHTTGARKQQVLKQYDRPEIREFLKFVFDEITYVYHVSPTFKPSPLSVYEREYLVEEERTLLHALARRDLTGSAAQQAVRSCVTEHGPLINFILDRNIQCGIAATTINKALPGCIPQFKVQLAKEVPLTKLVYPRIAELKYDGVRLVTLINQQGDVTFKTRNGKTPHLPRLAEIISHSGLQNRMIDGEIIIGRGAAKDRTSVSGMINSAMHGGRIMEQILEYVVFDTMDLFEFYSCKCISTYLHRRKTADNIVQLIGRPLTLSKAIQVNSPEEVSNMAEELYRDGMEGLILKDPSAKYTFNRSATWAKVKEVKTADLKVVGLIEGTGKYEGAIGALQCRGTVEGKDVVVNVGSGLSDDDRMRDHDDFDGKLIEVKYNSVIQDSRTKQWSLFLPRYSHIRIDK